MLIQAMENRAILVIEDSEPLRALLKKVLTKDGFRVFDARGGNEALEILKEIRVEFIISDLEMPTGDGPSLFAFLKQKQVKIPTLILTGHTDAKLEGYASYGVKAVLHKPLDEQVFQKIREFLK